MVACSASYFFDRSGTTVPDPYGDIGQRAKKLLKTESICVLSHGSRPDPWSILEIQDGPSSVVGEVLAFEPGSLQLFPPLEPIPFDVRPCRQRELIPDATFADQKSEDVSSHVREKFLQWMRDCSRNHESCKPSNGKWYVPTRLIQVSMEDTGSQRPTLKATLCELGTSLPARYLALSYRWPKYSAADLGETIPTLTRTIKRGTQSRHSHG